MALSSKLKYLKPSILTLKNVFKCLWCADLLAFKIVKFHIIKLQVTSCIQPVKEGRSTGSEKDAPVGGAEKYCRWAVHTLQVKVLSYFRFSQGHGNGELVPLLRAEFQLNKVVCFSGKCLQYLLS